MVFTRTQQSLLNWYLQNARPLLWRQTKDPYKIWISEVMLQQTTSTAVTPYYERFIEKFPTISGLAGAQEAEILEMWVGLGYYSRAKNLHKASKKIHKNGFPCSYQQLLELPGFGPYTARAVSSLAFGESVGVLDGNVIRFLCRFYGFKIDWWRPKPRAQLQNLADQWVFGVDSGKMNQALMEIGATLCTPQSPACLLCPLKTGCVAFSEKSVNEIPLKKPRRAKEIWVWNAQIYERKGKIAFVKNNYAPFLRGQIIFPGSVRKQGRVPKIFDYKHNITHHEIFVKLHTKTLNSKMEIPKNTYEWVRVKDIKKRSCFSLIQKALGYTALPFC